MRKGEPTPTPMLPARQIPALALDLDEAAAALSVSRTTIKDLIRLQKIRPVAAGKKGGKPIVPVTELQRFLDDSLAGRLGEVG